MCVAVIEGGDRYAFGTAQRLLLCPKCIPRRKTLRCRTSCVHYGATTLSVSYTHTGSCLKSTPLVSVSKITFPSCRAQKRIHRRQHYLQKKIPSTSMEAWHRRVENEMAATRILFRVETRNRLREVEHATGRIRGKVKGCVAAIRVYTYTIV